MPSSHLAGGANFCQCDVQRHRCAGGPFSEHADARRPDARIQPRSLRPLRSRRHPRRFVAFRPVSAGENAGRGDRMTNRYVDVGNRVHDHRNDLVTGRSRKEPVNSRNIPLFRAGGPRASPLPSGSTLRWSASRSACRALRLASRTTSRDLDRARIIRGSKWSRGSAYPRITPFAATYRPRK